MTPSGRHPEELLAEYVDGMLNERDRRAVHTHLATCATCRDEVDLADAARQALNRVPEEAVPLGVTGRVMDEASGLDRTERTAWGQRIQWVAGIAAAAALVAVVAISLPGVGGDATTPGDGGGAAATIEASGDTTAPQSQERSAFTVSLEESDRDFGDKALRGLATGVAQAVRDGSLAPRPDAGTPKQTQEALECIATWAAPAEDEVLVRLIRATYEDEPAYLAVYLQGPGSGEPPSKAIVWVVSADGSCGFLDITEKLI